MMIVMISIARPAVAMHAMYSHSIAVVYVVLMSREGPRVDRRGGPVFREWKGYFVSRMRCRRAEYLAPYLSRTGCVALKKASLSAGTNCTPFAFSSSVALAVFSSQSL